MLVACGDASLGRVETLEVSGGLRRSMEQWEKCERAGREGTKGGVSEGHYSTADESVPRGLHWRGKRAR